MIVREGEMMGREGGVTRRGEGDGKGGRCD